MQPKAEANILNQIADKTIERVASYKEQISATEMMAKARALNPDTGFLFENALIILLLPANNDKGKKKSKLQLLWVYNYREKRHEISERLQGSQENLDC